jgi:hypothetical protein
MVNNCIPFGFLGKALNVASILILALVIRHFSSMNGDAKTGVFPSGPMREYQPTHHATQGEKHVF